MNDGERFVIGIDLSFNNIGTSIFKFENGKLKFVAARNIKNEISSNKKTRRKSNIFLERIYLSIDRLEDFISLFVRDGKRLFCVEFPTTGSKSGTANRALGMAIGMLGAYFALTNFPVDEASPKEVKIAATGKGDASKDLVKSCIIKKLGGRVESKKIIRVSKSNGREITAYNEKFITSKGIFTGGDWEHIADSIGAILHCKRNSDLYKIFIQA